MPSSIHSPGSPDKLPDDLSPDQFDDAAPGRVHHVGVCPHRPCLCIRVRSHISWLLNLALLVSLLVPQILAASAVTTARCCHHGHCAVWLRPWPCPGASHTHVARGIISTMTIGARQHVGACVGRTPVRRCYSALTRSGPLHERLKAASTDARLRIRC